MKKQLIKHLLLLAKFAALHEASPFKIKAYEHAARTIDFAPAEIFMPDIQARDLSHLKGIGAGLTQTILEFAHTGSSTAMQEYAHDTPAGILELLYKVRGLGVKKLIQLWKELDITSVDDLVQACEAGRIAKVKGFGEKMQANLLISARFAMSVRAYVRCDTALAVALNMQERLLAEFPYSRACYTGAVRRQMEVVEFVEMMACITMAQACAFCEKEQGVNIVEQGGVLAFLHPVFNAQIKIYVCEEAQFFYTLFTTTGSVDFIRIWEKYQKISQDVVGEEAIFSQAGIPFLSPYLREILEGDEVGNNFLGKDKNEINLLEKNNEASSIKNNFDHVKEDIELSIKNNFDHVKEDIELSIKNNFDHVKTNVWLSDKSNCKDTKKNTHLHNNTFKKTNQKLNNNKNLSLFKNKTLQNYLQQDIALSRKNIIQNTDIHGVIHAHSTWSDGANTIEQMARACIEKGFSYLVLSDHSISSSVAGGLNVEQIRAQHREIDALNNLLAPFKIFKSIECDILADGTLDYIPSVRALFDVLIASVHQQLDMSKSVATERVCRAIESGEIDIMGHISGRILLARPAYELDYARVFDACVRTKTAIEINASPSRLDLDWRVAREALARGIRVSIDPDAHSMEGVGDTRWGVWVAQKAGVTARDNISSFTLAEMEQWVASCKARRQL